MSTGLMTAASGRLSRRRTLLGWLFGLALPALATLISVSGQGLLGLPTDVMLPAVPGTTLPTHVTLPEVTLPGLPGTTLPSR